MRNLKLRAGDWVEVRTKDEILGTLDKRGHLDGLPFMPEMFEHCGKRFRVYKRAHKTCDTVNNTGGRRMEKAVHLEGVRCDGKAHGSCQASCLVFWKEAWLKRITDGGIAEPGGFEHTEHDRSTATFCTEMDVIAGASVEPNDADPTYICQATQLPRATKLLRWWDMWQYIEDYTSKNVSLTRIARTCAFVVYYRLIKLGIGWGPLLRWVYDKVQALRNGVPFPRKQGKIPTGEKTPTLTLNLQPGEWVRVRSHQDILGTLDSSNKNRGLYFDAEEVPFCGGTYRVERRVSRIIDEKTGKLLKLKNEAVILEGVCCQARYSSKRLFCPRSIYPMWREIWLERIQGQEVSPNSVQIASINTAGE